MTLFLRTQTEKKYFSQNRVILLKISILQLCYLSPEKNKTRSVTIFFLLCFTFYLTLFYLPALIWREKKKKKSFGFLTRIFLTLMKQDLVQLIFQYVVNRLIPGQIRFFQSWNSIRKDHKRALNSFSLLKRGHLPAMFQTLGLAEQKSETKIWVKSARAGFHPTRFLTHGCLAEFLASSQLFIKAGGQISCRGDTKISLLMISDFIIWR